MSQSNTQGFFIRFYAAVLEVLLKVDLLLILGMCLVQNTFFVNKTNSDLIFSSSFMYLVVYTVFLITCFQVLNLIYITYFVSHFGGGLGKLLFGISIVDSSSNNLIDLKTALLRTTVGYSFSSVFFGLGFVRTLFSGNSNLAWHDELFNTRVIKTTQPLIGYLMLIVSFFMFCYLVSYAITMFTILFGM